MPPHFLTMQIIIARKNLYVYYETEKVSVIERDIVVIHTNGSVCNLLHIVTR